MKGLIILKKVQTSQGTVKPKETHLLEFFYSVKNLEKGVNGGGLGVRQKDGGDH